MEDLDDRLAQDYLADCRDHLAAIEADLLTIGIGEAEIEDQRLNRIVRALHAMAGPADYFEFTAIRELAYQSEDLVAMIRYRHLVPTTVQLHALLSAKDKLDELVQSPETCNRIDITTVTAELAGLKENDPSAVNSSGSSDAARSRGSDRGPLRILLAEDDFACRLLLQTFLSRYGECHVAVNGLEAVEAFRTAFEEDRKYDLICMDIMMPQMDGREAVRTIRAVEEAQGIHSTRGVKIFMTTTVQGIKEVFSCFNELCDAYLLKPIDLGKLLGQLKFYQLLE